MGAPRIEIKQNGITTEVFADGKKLSGIRKICFEYENKDCLPVLKLDFLATDLAIDGQFIPELPEIFTGFYKRKEPAE